ncbi:uncharacterized protein LOC132624318 [Lycium barbarum]|uniref:uncharacterized protein LOC132624318 n=1 Tax=Lycium barbarum TaxID=112863 RepID=UPI00293EF8BA|nr:uncharacterized protein LOC132624318 [Lycium barbarum]
MDSNFEALNCLQSCITEEDNVLLNAIPTIPEIQDCVFSLDPDSAPGLDGLSGMFNQKTWHIIANDLHRAIKAFFIGATLPKFYTHTCLVLIPKIDQPQDPKYQTLQYSSQDHLKNLSGFVKEKTIPENILVAQETVNDINKPNRGGNVIIKLDMTKAYNRNWIELIRNVISNNWYSVLINGGINRFFKSSRGLRQGDPLSPSLFILSTENLSQMLNKLPRNPRYKGFWMNIMGPQINHLTFADDTILFCNGSKRPMQLLMNTLSKYEEVSGQLINKNKSCFAMGEKTSLIAITRVKLIIGMRFHKLPMKYWGCPLFIEIKLNDRITDFVNKVVNRIKGWHTQFLSTGGRATLIRHVLLAMPIHLLTAISPTKGTLELIEKYINRFFWSRHDN